jgi:hypothetical protein
MLILFEISQRGWLKSAKLLSSFFLRIIRSYIDYGFAGMYLLPVAVAFVKF